MDFPSKKSVCFQKPVLKDTFLPSRGIMEIFSIQIGKKFRNIMTIDFFLSKQSTIDLLGGKNGIL